MFHGYIGGLGGDCRMISRMWETSLKEGKGNTLGGLWSFWGYTGRNGIGWSFWPQGMVICGCSLRDEESGWDGL
jgi:hypothetical protein